jgi:hypothetical protein
MYSSIETLLDCYKTSSDKVDILKKVYTCVESISPLGNALSEYRAASGEDSIKIRFSALIKDCLMSMRAVEQYQKYQNENLQLLRLHLELVIEFGWYHHLETANKTIEDFITKNIFPDHKNILISFGKMLKISALMISLEISRDRLKCLLREYNTTESFEKELHNIIFHLLADTKLRRDIDQHRVKMEGVLILGENPRYYSSQFRQMIGKLYLLNLEDSERKIWDIVNYYVVFFDFIHFERENHDEVQDLLEFYKNADFKTQQAIRQELKSQKFITSLLNSTRVFSKTTEMHHDTTLLYSEIYFTEGKNTQWANSCQGVGYFIIRYDEGWVSLYNTKIGYMTNETGILFDAQLLDSTFQDLCFKVLKRDGWHLFKSSVGLDSISWDSIELLCPSDQSQNNPGYILCKKDKTFHLLEEENGKILKNFEEARTVQFITHRPAPIFSVKIKNNWNLFDLSKGQFIENLPIEIKNLYLVERSDTFLVLEGKNRKCYLYDLDSKKHFLLKNVKKVRFASFSDVFGEDDNGHFFVIKNFREEIQIHAALFERLIGHHLSTPKFYAGLQSYGMGIFKGTVARYDFKMELQGTYHITKEEDKCILWLHNTVGGGRTATLCEDAQNIHYLGVSKVIQDDQKIFFLIEQDNDTVFLYVSYYSKLKSLLDSNPKVKNIPHDRINLPSKKIKFLHDNYLCVFDKDQWQLYEHNFGFHVPIQAEAFEALDHKNFLKMKKNGQWFLYDLSKRHALSVKGAKSIEISAEDRIMFIYDDHIRYLKYDNLPECVQIDIISESLEKALMDDIQSDNYNANLVKLKKYQGLNDSNYSQPFATLLLSYVDHQLLIMMSSNFVKKIAELLDGKFVDFSNITQGLLSLISEVNAYVESFKIKSNQLTEFSKTIKKNIRSLLKHFNEIEKYLDTSLSLHKDVVSFLEDLNSDKLKELGRELSSLEGDIITTDLSKLTEKIDAFKKKEQKKQNIYSMFSTHRHMLSGILRYWFSVDPQGEKIDILYHHLLSLADLHDRTLCSENYIDSGKTILRKHYLNLMKLYSFGSSLINNYIIAEILDLNIIQDLLSLFDLLRIDKKELKIFSKVLELGPSLQEQYEKLDTNAQELEYSRLKQFMHVLRLMAIANELKSESVYTLDLEAYKKSSKNSDRKLAEDMARQIQKDFYRNIGVKVVIDGLVNIDEQYLIDIMCANENLKNNDQVMLIILLKAAIYQLDLKILFTTTLPLNMKERFSKTEQALLGKLQEHNNKVKSDFYKRNIDWNIWQSGVEKIQGCNITIALWERNVSHDLFQGEFCNSCISLSKGNARANLHYLADFNFSMIEIIENSTKKTIGHVTVWIGQDEDNQLILVLNSVQVHRRYQSHAREIRNLIFDYACQFSKELGINKVVLALGHNAIPVHQVLREIDDIGQDESSSHWLQVSDSDDKKKPTVFDDEIKIKLITSTFYKDIYSDIYCDSWICVDDMINESANIWDISLFASQAKSLSIDSFKLKPELLSIKDYEFWIIDNEQLKDIKISNQDEVHLVFISKTYWDIYRENVFDEIYQRIQSSLYEEPKSKDGGSESLIFRQQGIGDVEEEKAIQIAIQESELEQARKQTMKDAPIFLEGNRRNLPPLEDDFSEEIPASIRAESLSLAMSQGRIGPRQILGWKLHDVKDVGNCFYEAVIHQMQLINHAFLATVPSETLARNSLRLRIEGENFRDRQWADHEEIIKLAQEFNLVVAIVDTRTPQVGFVYHYVRIDGNYDSTPDNALVSGREIIALAYTGDHYLSVVSSPLLTPRTVAESQGVQLMNIAAAYLAESSHSNRVESTFPRMLPQFLSGSPQAGIDAEMELMQSQPEKDNGQRF